MENAHPFMPTRAEGHDPNVCAASDCGKVWNAAIHQPSLYLDNGGVPEGLVPVERASGGYMPRGFGLMHGFIQHPSDRRLKCAFAPACVNLVFSSRHTLDVHLEREHGIIGESAQSYLDNPWYEGESRSDWKERTFHTRYAANIKTIESALNKVAEVQDSAVFQADDEPDEYCDHPNGFGPMGCPCGATFKGYEDPPTFRNLRTGKDEPAVACPFCPAETPSGNLARHLKVEHPDAVFNEVAEDSPIWGHQVECPGGCGDAFIKGELRRHLQTAHQWTGDTWDDWAERTNFLELPSVPQSIVHDARAASLKQIAAWDKFLDPNTTMEQLMADEVNPDELNKAAHAAEALITDWWMGRAEEEAKAVLPKAVVYGSNSLMQLGRKMGQMQGREVSDEEALELGCWINAVQKIERWTDAVMRGERCSDDTIYDAGVYLKMVQRIRDVGSWPGV